MKALYDGKPITLTPRFIRAIKSLMRAECEMMRQNDPEYADCWTWGLCEIGDLSRMNALECYYGGEDSRPKGKRWILKARKRGAG